MRSKILYLVLIGLLKPYVLTPTLSKIIPMKKILAFVVFAICILSCMDQKKVQVPPVIAPFSNVDTLAINDWWNRANNPIIDLKVGRDSVIAFGIYTVLRG